MWMCDERHDAGPKTDHSTEDGIIFLVRGVRVDLDHVAGYQEQWDGDFTLVATENVQLERRDRGRGGATFEVEGGQYFESGIVPVTPGRRIFYCTRSPRP
jgi:hypothetical protein